MWREEREEKQSQDTSFFIFFFFCTCVYSLLKTKIKKSLPPKIRGEGGRRKSGNVFFFGKKVVK